MGTQSKESKVNFHYDRLTANVRWLAVFLYSET